MEENGWKKPETKDELITLMKEIKDKGIIPLSFGNSNYQGAVDWLYSTFTSCYAGPDVLRKALTGEGKFTDPKLTASIQTMVDWWTEGWLGDNADVYKRQPCGELEIPLSCTLQASEIFPEIITRRST